MKVYFVSPFDIRYSTGGTEWHIYEYAKFLMDNNVSVSLLISNRKGHSKLTRDYKSISRRYSAIPKTHINQIDVEVFRKAHMITYFGLPKDGIVYLPYSLLSSLLNILLKPPKQKYVVASHAFQLKNGKLIRGTHQVYETLLRAFVKIVLKAKGRDLSNIYFHVLNTEQVGYLTKIGICKKNITLIPPMMDTTPYKISPNKSKKLRIIHVGGAAKESSLIVQIIKILKKMDVIRNFEFYFVGYVQPYELIQLSKTLSNIHIFAAASEKKKQRILSDVDVMIVPAYETFSKTMLEGFVSGTYVITSNKTNSVKDIRKLGIQFSVTKTGDPSEYIPLLLKLADMKAKGKNINPYKIRNREIAVKKFDMSVVLPYILKMFIEIENS